MFKKEQCAEYWYFVHITEIDTFSF